MWTYIISTGELKHDGVLEGYGYSGSGEFKNDPNATNVPDEGPLPTGGYGIGEFYTDSEKGPLVSRLTPVTDNIMFDRSGFMIHGDSVAHPGCASHGCICLGHNTRLLLSLSLDRDLEVLS